jgi:hypothetical protein
MDPVCPKVSTPSAHAMTANCAKPGEPLLVAAQHGYSSTMRRQVRKQSFDMGTRVHNSGLSRALCSGPRPGNQLNGAQSASKR